MKNHAKTYATALAAALLLPFAALRTEKIAHAQEATPPFETASCETMLKSKVNNPLFASIPPDKALECGYVTVPEEHGKDNGKTIQLAVAVLRARDASNRRDDPLFLMQGGPGGETIGFFYLVMANAPAKGADLRETRDLVMIDQRGTGKSRPALTCKETYELAVRTAEMNLQYEESLKLSNEAMNACRQRLIDEGVNLSAFDSVENARDIDSVRRALGYESINLYGVSYGTLLALHAMRELPNAIRSVIIDAVVPTQNNFVIETGDTRNRAYTELFNACKADTVCNRDYPNLEETFYSTIAKLDTTPARVRFVDPYTQKDYRGYLNGEALNSLVFQALYSNELRPLIPRMITELRDGKSNVASTMVSFVSFDQSVAYGMYYSVICAEDADFDPNDADRPNIREELRKTLVRDAVAFKDSCSRFNVEQLPDAVDEPVRSEIPTLVFSGQFDPITPPVNGTEAAKTLPNSYEFVFPGTGHGALTSSPCARDIAQAFLDDPGTRPDGTCAKGMDDGTFSGKGDIIAVPAVAESMRVMLPSAMPPRDVLLQLGAVLIALLVLATGVILLPLGWLARLIFGKNHPTLKPPAIANLMPWLTVLYLLLALGFVGGLYYSAIEAALAENPAMLIGVPGSARPLFFVPLVCIAIALLMLWGVVAGWRSGAWGLGRKLYRGVLAVSALVPLIVFALWGVYTLGFTG